MRKTLLSVVQCGLVNSQTPRTNMLTLNDMRRARKARFAPSLKRKASHLAHLEGNGGDNSAIVTSLFFCWFLLLFILLLFSSRATSYDDMFPLNSFMLSQLFNLLRQEMS